MTDLLGFAALAAEIGWFGWRIIKRLKWLHDVLIPFFVNLEQFINPEKK